jgi:hypothetical protein
VTRLDLLLVVVLIPPVTGSKFFSMICADWLHMEREGFEPSKAVAGRFTVCSR